MLSKVQRRWPVWVRSSQVKGRSPSGLRSSCREQCWKCDLGRQPWVWVPIGAIHWERVTSLQDSRGVTPQRGGKITPRGGARVCGEQDHFSDGQTSREAAGKGVCDPELLVTAGGRLSCWKSSVEQLASTKWSVSFFLIKLFFKFIVWVWMCISVCATVQVWRSEDSCEGCFFSLLYVFWGPNSCL